MPTISISTYNFTVYLQNITNGKDLIDKIDDFFIQIQIDKDYIAFNSKKEIEINKLLQRLKEMND